ncbi:MAG TPA: polysaccharide pyruvyl transferase family protein [Baekduia sp.]|nr:polysaccharide pyruvyl transferase family protein [Baekduia sp.]
MPGRIAFISPTGSGNLGDAAIIDSLIQGVRRRIPDAEIVGFTQNPYDTTARHEVRAYTCTGVSMPKYKMTESAPPDDEDGDDDEPRPSALSAARGALSLVPGLRPAYRLVRLTLAERRHRRLSAERIRGFDFVVVAGGGQLDDFWGGAFGHPYALMRWADLARSAGARYVILSVGTGSLASRLSALFVRRALAMADYRSFRDGRSRDLVGDPELTRDDPIVPDLAYSVPLAPEAERPPAARSIVGVSPMAYADPRVWPVRDLARYRRHVETMATLTVRLARAGHEVVLFTSDSPDRRSLAEVRGIVDAQLRPDERTRIRVPVIDGVVGLMQVLAGVDIVVAARLHGVLLGHVAGRPALAVSHERKVRTLMDEMGHGRYCFEIDDFDPEAGWTRLGEIDARRPELAAEIGRTVADYRRRVDAQYDRVFGAAR